MEHLFEHIALDINAHAYVKNPLSSDLGKRILFNSIQLIHQQGFENITFKKIAQHINTSEASIYRYFENKHQLLLYLISWYWAWLFFKIKYETHNISNPETRLKNALKVITEDRVNDDRIVHISEQDLYDIVIAESTKIYLSSKVDMENEKGLFAGYKKLVGEINQIIQEINPDFIYGNMLISTVIEGVHHQKFFAAHLPKLTNNINQNSIQEFYENLVLKTIKA